jgi:Novel toxin 15
VECFNKPKGMSDKEFARQLKEQQDAINNMDANKMLERRQAIKDAGGTTPLRDLGAQSAARANYQTSRTAELIAGGMSRRDAAVQVAGELSGLAATHRLDIIAGGNPSDISGMGDRSVNSSLGSQWKGRRSQSLEDHAREMKAKGKGKDKMNVKLKKC